ncbi:MAG: hypothetical protein ACK56F_26310 [bacterium]
MERYTPLAPGGPSLGLKEDILFLEIAYFYIFGGAAKLRWAGGGAQRTGAHARPKPTSLSYIYLGYFVCVCVCVSQFVSERSAILLDLAIKLTKETRRRVWRGRDRDGEIWKGTERRGRV